MKATLRGGWQLGLVLACGAGLFLGCLNPRPEDFPSNADDAPGDAVDGPALEQPDDVTPNGPPDSEYEPPAPPASGGGSPDAGAPSDTGAAGVRKVEGDAGAAADAGAPDAGCTEPTAE